MSALAAIAQDCFSRPGWFLGAHVFLYEVTSPLVHKADIQFHGKAKDVLDADKTGLVKLLSTTPVSQASETPVATQERVLQTLGVLWEYALPCGNVNVSDHFQL